MTEQPTQPIPPGVCIPWEERVKEYAGIQGDPQVVERVWKEIDGLGYLYLWFCLIAS